MGSYSYVENFQVALTYSTQILIDLIPKVYDTERIIRIRGEDGAEKMIPVNAREDSDLFSRKDISRDYIVPPSDGVTKYYNDLSVGKYDVIVTIGPSYDTQRQEMVTMLLDLIASMPQVGPAMLDILIQNIDMPGVDELVKRAKKLVPVEIRGLEPGEEPPQKEPNPEVIIELKKLQLDFMKMINKEFETRTNAIAKLMSAEAKQQGEQLKGIASFVEQMRESMIARQQKDQGEPTQ